jgi:hypothetical protein
MTQDQKPQGEKGSIELLTEMLEQGVKGEQPYAKVIKKEVFPRLAKAAGWRDVDGDSGHFVSKTNTHIFINKVAKDPRTGSPLINPATDTRMIPDLVIVGRGEITIIDHVWEGSDRHLEKTAGYAKALEKAWRLPVKRWDDFDLARRSFVQARARPESLARRRLAEQTANALWRESQRQSQQGRLQYSRAAARRPTSGAAKAGPAGRGAALFLLALELAKLVVQAVEAFKGPDPGNAKLTADLKLKLSQLQKAEEAEGRLLIAVLKSKVRPDEVLRAEAKDVFEANEQRMQDFESMFWWEFVSVDREDYAERANLASTTRLSASVVANNLFPDLAKGLECPYEDGSLEALQWVTNTLDIQQTFRKLSEEASREYLELAVKARAQPNDK